MIIENSFASAAIRGLLISANHYGLHILCQIGHVGAFLSYGTPEFPDCGNL